jgi:hypothetical protein
VLDEDPEVAGALPPYHRIRMKPPSHRAVPHGRCDEIRDLLGVDRRDIPDHQS